MTQKYKVGERVRIREDAEQGLWRLGKSEYGPIPVPHAGEYGRVQEVSDSGSYALILDSGEDVAWYEGDQLERRKAE